MLTPPAPSLTHSITERLGALPWVGAVALGDSRVGGVTDAVSDQENIA